MASEIVPWFQWFLFTFNYANLPHLPIWLKRSLVVVFLTPGPIL